MFYLSFWIKNKAIATFSYQHWLKGNEIFIVPLTHQACPSYEINQSEYDSSK